ncbi:MAG: hypothetical protein ABI828_05395 [Actinomycetota bacterium]
MANKKRRKPATQPGRSPAKSERREEQRRLRAEAEKQAARAQRIRSILIRLGVGVVLAAIVYVVLQNMGSSSPGTPPATVSPGSPTVAPSRLAGIQDGNAPWTAGNDPTDLRSRLADIGLPALPEEVTVVHIHQHLEVFVDGDPVVVPADIGIAPDQSFISPLHTHDTSGIMHVEAPAPHDFTLGDFFDVWGVKFTPTCIGGYCNKGDATLAVYVNGHEANGDPGLVLLRSHDEIVVAYGTPAQLPAPIPSKFKFPLGL